VIWGGAVFIAGFIAGVFRRASSAMRTPIALPPHKIGSSTMQRNRFTQTITLGDRLAHEAERLRQKARTAPARKECARLLRKARQLETASHINEWLSSPGLQTRQ
jgi:hypothetical protein